jgi:hypothetical protein
MTDYSKDNLSSLDRSTNECYSIAESMIEEIHLMTVKQEEEETSKNVRHKGSLKRKLLRQVRLARGIAAFGKN